MLPPPCNLSTRAPPSRCPACATEMTRTQPRVWDARTYPDGAEGDNVLHRLDHGVGSKGLQAHNQHADAQVTHNVAGRNTAKRRAPADMPPVQENRPPMGGLLTRSILVAFSSCLCFSFCMHVSSALSTISATSLSSIRYGCGSRSTALAGSHRGGSGAIAGAAHDPGPAAGCCAPPLPPRRRGCARLLLLSRHMSEGLKRRGG